MAVPRAGGLIAILHGITCNGNFQEHVQQNIATEDDESRCRVLAKLTQLLQAYKEDCCGLTVYLGKARISLCMRIIGEQNGDC